MNHNAEQLKNPVIVILFFFTCLFLFTKILGPIPLSVNSTQTMKSQPFMVQGVGEEKAVADTAMVSLGVIEHAETAEEAKNKMNEITNKVVADIKALGIAEKDIKTTNFSVYEDPNMPYPLPNITDDVIIERPTMVGPQAPSSSLRGAPVVISKSPTKNAFAGSQTIEVRVKSIELANQVIDVATADGANALNTPQFVVNEAKRKELVKKARKKAIAEAKAKAKELADEAGIKLGKVVDIQEYSDGGMYYGGVMSKSAEMSVAPDRGTELNPGEDTVRVNVTLSYETL